MMNREVGKVWLIGAGPGDPDLLTVKAMRAIETADLILFDQLVSDEIKACFPKSVPAFFVGKSKNNHSIPQEDLNALLVKKARQGLSIARVKGGDPFVFGRGGEEMLILRQAGIDVEVVSGITSASGCTTAAGIPLTHRGLSQGCTFITAHAQSELSLNWHSLATSNTTLVFYMGVTKSEFIAKNLLSGGLRPNTPVAIIENGCRANQREIIGELQELNKLVAEHQVQSPSIIVVGDVVSLSAHLHPSLENNATLEQIVA